MGDRQGTSNKHFQIQKASSAMFAATIVASIVVSFSIVTLKMLWESRSFNSKVHSAQQEAKDILGQNIENYDSLMKEYQALEGSEEEIIANQGEKSNSAVILDALPSKYDFPAIVTAIQNVASTSGVVLEGFSGQDSVGSAIVSSPDPSPVEIPFSISISGSYTGLQKFLDRIERTIRPYHIQNIQIAGSDRNLRINIEMITYYQPAIDVGNVITEEISQ